MGMIRAEKLVFEYDKRDEEGNVIGSHRAIDGVDIDVPQGSFVAILGHNGSGKSTLAKHMNAILVPTGGTMWVDGRDTKDPNELWNIRQSAGMVFQNPDNRDYRNCCRRGSRIRSGELRSSYGRDPETGREQSACSRYAGAQKGFSK